MNSKNSSKKLNKQSANFIFSQQLLSFCFIYLNLFVQITKLQQELEVSQSDRTAVINRYIQKNFLFQTMTGFVLICSLRKVCPKR